MESARHTADAELALQRADFLAEDELIEISPMVKSGKVVLVCGNFGPFEPSIATRVPLWLALALKKVRRCKIIPPKWLQVRAVESVVQYEQEHEGSLHPLPFFFHQVSHSWLRPRDSVHVCGDVVFISDFESIYNI